MMIMKMYYSREDRVAELNTEDDRVNYEDLEADDNKLRDALGLLYDCAADIESSVDNYLDSIEDEGNHMLVRRQQMVHSWAMLQAATSKLAWILRIDGNTAYERLMTALKNGTTTNMEGL